MARTRSVSRREFIAGTVAATAAGPLLATPPRRRTRRRRPPALTRKVKLGVVGLGGRGRLDRRAVREARRLRHARGRRLLSARGGRTGHGAWCRSVAPVLRPVRIQTSDRERHRSDCARGPSVLLPRAGAAHAVDAGLHVYMAKPIASDVPGVLSIRESAKRATAQQRVFLVDYQMPTDPHNAEVIRQIRSGGLGRLQTVFSAGASGWADGLRRSPRSPRISKAGCRNLIWVNDDALGCGYIGNYDIHVIDIVLRALGKVPVSANGWGARYRAEPHGDALDSVCTMFTFDDGHGVESPEPQGQLRALVLVERLARRRDPGQRRQRAAVVLGEGLRSWRSAPRARRCSGKPLRGRRRCETSRRSTRR